MGMVNCLRMFFPELQKLLQLIYNLTRKGRSSYGGRTTKCFEEIRHRLIRPPILYMPNCEGRFHLY